MTEIVKVLAAVTNRDFSMVYNKSRQRLIVQTLDDKARARMGRDLKAYFEAEWKGGGWALGQRVDTQPW